MTSRHPRQVRFLNAVIQSTSTDRCLIEVEIRGTVDTYRGRCEGGCSEPEQLRAAALATIQAITELGHKVELEAVEAVNVLGDWTVALRVIAEHEGQRRKLTGFCLAGNDVLKATAFAVLNATNRFLDIG
ncbi:MAG: hypothetical protein HY700_21745 [Gemmatimonadetes bacterium]|nr:hypothetical protein [Gemmatimonadota bacterium]